MITNKKDLKYNHRISKHKKFWKEYGKRKFRRMFKDINNEDMSCKKISFYSYLE